MDQSEVSGLPLQHAVNINWVVPESVTALHATNLVVQQRGTEVSLLFFELRPPIIAGTPEQQAQVYQNMTSLDAVCVAKIVVSIENMQEMSQLVNSTAHQLQEQIQRLMNSQKGIE